MKTLLILLLLGFASTTFGQQRFSGTNAITLDQAIRLALDSNYSSRSAMNELTIAQYTGTRANDNLLPTASGSGRYDYTRSLTDRGPFFDKNSHGLSYNIGAGINIYNGGFDAANIRSAGYNLDAAKYNVKWIRQQVAFNVVSAYINALRTKELVATNEKSLAESQAQLDRIKGLFSAGSVPVIQVYQQEAVVGQQQVQTIAARNNFLNAKTDLLFLLNIPPDSYNNYDVTLSGIDTSVVSLKSNETGIQPTPSLISSLLDQRQDFLAQRASILSSEAAIGLTRSALLPRLGANIGIGGAGSNPQIQSIKLFHSLTGGLNLTVPIYDAAQNRLQIEIQEVQLETSKIHLEQSEQQFRSDIAKAQNNLSSAQQILTATESELRSAEESLRSASERLRLGAGIQLDVIIAETQALTARTDRVNAIYSYLFATRQLEYLLGKTNY